MEKGEGQCAQKAGLTGSEGVRWGWVPQPLRADGAACCQLQLSKKAPRGSDSRERSSINGHHLLRVSQGPG